MSKGKGKDGKGKDYSPLNDDYGPNKIFVGGLAHGTSQSQIRDHFDGFGPISHIEMSFVPRGF